MNRSTPKRSLVLEALSISSGTLATLTNQSTYKAIKPIQESFVFFCKENHDQFDNWIQAWKLFWAGYLENNQL